MMLYIQALLSLHGYVCQLARSWGLIGQTTHQSFITLVVATDVPRPGSVLVGMRVHPHSDGVTYVFKRQQGLTPLLEEISNCRQNKGEKWQNAGADYNVGDS